MLILLLLLAQVWASNQSEDFENAKIYGTPRLICSKKWLTLEFDTNIPFQGRISVIKRLHRQPCVQDYSANIQRNASFKVELQHCMELSYMNNGSRVYSAQIEVGFHPLVITSSDRLFSVRCIDNSHAAALLTGKKEDNPCVHTIRLASRWESSTIFHVGDAIIHEWNCDFNVKGGQKYQTFLTSCNALSNGGQIIHLVDENGCIVDSELMGEVVYNNYMPRIFARARVFKLMNDEKYRIECHVQMCTAEGLCKDRIFPPKCAFTKEEILNRYMSKAKADSIEDTIMAGTINNRYERQVRVVSEWITVHNSAYTNIDQLNERYYLSTVMNDQMEETNENPLMRHFLMGISYRDPNQNDTVRNESKDAEVSKAQVELSSSLNHIAAPITSFDIDSVEKEKIIDASVPVIDGVPVMVETSSTKTTTETSSNVSRANLYLIRTIIHPYLFGRTQSNKDKAKQAETSTQASSLNSTSETSETVSKNASTAKSTTSREPTMTTAPSTEEFPKQTKGGTSTSVPLSNKITIETTTQKVMEHEAPATLHFYTTTKTTILSTSTKLLMSSKFSTQPAPILDIPQKIKVSEDGMIMEDVTDYPEPNMSVVNKNTLLKDKFENPRDWRLDDRTINDTDMFPEKQVACSNATIIASQRKCTWSGIEHLLVVWSFASLLVWMVMIAVCFYRQANKPAWVEFSERTTSTVSPWIRMSIMLKSILFLSVLAVGAVSTQRNDMIPKEFLDVHFVESKQQNLEDYLALRGVPWFVRKLIAGKMQKGQFLMKADGGDAYIYNTANAARSMEYHFKLGEEFTDTGFDGKQHKITITMEDGKLKESHTQLERDTGGPDIFYYTLQDGNLISTCEASKNGKTAVWRREFVKKE
ncbi:unnamed protein product [Cylicocyclus nassatus]|uniref:ZP domain-containing protein n=1 Tax=Cylicocyclus nassatus TaxID=53992 RepID=A0AA36HFI8_CYLNA|nr:unnamed protein product [Cylicocyclus nassatus]